MYENSLYYGLKINGEWFISHCDSPKEVWEEIEAVYKERYPHIDFSRGVIVTHRGDLRW